MYASPRCYRNGSLDHRDGLRRLSPVTLGRLGSGMKTDLERVRAYYSRFGEWERLDSPSGNVEFRRACALLDAHLPTGARILDLGGGPGRYSIEIARRGHRVVLADLSPALLETARVKFVEAKVTDSIESIDEVDAQDLARYPDGRFDAVVAFGPFYHFISTEERRSAAREIWRVLGPAGLAFVSFIPRLSGIAGLVERAANNPQQVPLGTLTRAASTGVFRNGAADGFQEGYYAASLELRGLFEEVGFTVLELVSLRSAANLLEAALLRIQGPLRSEVEHVLDEVARDPAVVETGGHAVLVARKAA
jgi:SAM-dependent methyltransferase